MTNSILAACVAVLATFSSTQMDLSAGDKEDLIKITVQIKNLRSSDGNLEVSLFNSEENFLKKGTKKVLVIQNTEMMSVTFEAAGPGAYAVSVIHDEDKDGELDAGIMGMPTEDYGFSNNAKGMFGPPDFSKAKFDVEEDMTIDISLN